MPRFKSKPTEIEAYQWFPGIPIKGVALVDGRNVVRTTNGQLVNVAPGDWIITEPDGNGHYPCKPAIFAARYELIEESDGN